MTERKSGHPHTNLAALGVLQGLLDKGVVPFLFRSGMGANEDKPMEINGGGRMRVFIPPTGERSAERFTISLKEARSITLIRDKLHRTS
ncbi:MAG: hypothetical protein A2171_00285 [Candidatus Levybacteria bacterium RBG_13_35_9]|nr:MAG: hypothetical protein A2171_00285 [Candidatus Levybacteria bacterium RBG_13_35_9]